MSNRPSGQRLRPSQQKHMNRLRAFKLNTLYLVPYILILSLGTLQYGYFVNENLVLSRQFIFDYGWEKKKQQLFALTLLNGFSSFGSCLGALFGSYYITKGRRDSIILANFLGAFSICISYFGYFESLLISRLILGLSGGIMIVCVPKAIEESVPNYHIGSFCSLINVSINAGFLFSMMAGSYMPEEYTEGMEPSYVWVTIIALPLIVQTMQVLMLFLFFKDDSLKYLIHTHQNQTALNVIEKIYMEDQDYDEILYQMKKYSKHDENDMISRAFIVDQEYIAPTFGEALFSARYRNATFTCIIFAILSQFSGFQAFITYSSSIFSTIKNEQVEIKAEQQQYLIIVVNFLSSLTGITFASVFGRKSLTVVGFSIASVLLAIIGYMHKLGFELDMFITSLLLVLIVQNTYGQTFWIYISEILVDKAMGIVLAAYQAAQFFVILSNQLMMQREVEPSWLFYIYSGCALGGAIMMGMTMKETSELSDRDKARLYSTDQGFNQYMLTPAPDEEEENLFA